MCHIVVLPRRDTCRVTRNDDPHFRGGCYYNCTQEIKCYDFSTLDVLHKVLDILLMLPYIIPMNQFAPPTESYTPVPEFQYNPRQREVDFAQLVASGGDAVGSLIKASIIPKEEAHKLTRSQLYDMAARLLKSPAIQERIDHFIQLHHASMNTSAARIKQELASIAFVDPSLAQEDRPYIDPTTGEETTRVAEVRDLRTLPRYVRAAIKEFYVDRDGIPRYKWHDKLKSLQMIADLEGLFNEAHAAKAPTISFNLGGNTTELRDVIDITPDPPQIPEFLK